MSNNTFLQNLTGCAYINGSEIPSSYYHIYVSKLGCEGYNFSLHFDDGRAVDETKYQLHVSLAENIVGSSMVSEPVGDLKHLGSLEQNWGDPRERFSARQYLERVKLDLLNQEDIYLLKITGETLSKYSTKYCNHWVFDISVELSQSDFDSLSNISSKNGDKMHKNV